MHKSQCDNCRNIHDNDRLVTPIPDLEERVDPGGIVPSGECPDCGALCYPIPDAQDKPGNIYKVEYTWCSGGQQVVRFEYIEADSYDDALSAFLEGAGIPDLSFEVTEAGTYRFFKSESYDTDEELRAENGEVIYGQVWVTGPFDEAACPECGGTGKVFVPRDGAFDKYIVVYTDGGIIQGVYERTTEQDALDYVRDYVLTYGFDPSFDDIRIFAKHAGQPDVDLSCELDIAEKVDAWEAERWQAKVARGEAGNARIDPRGDLR